MQTTLPSATYRIDLIDIAIIITIPLFIYMGLTITWSYLFIVLFEIGSFIFIIKKFPSGNLLKKNNFYLLCRNSSELAIIECTKSCHLFTFAENTFIKHNVIMINRKYRTFPFKATKMEESEFPLYLSVMEMTDYGTKIMKGVS